MRSPAVSAVRAIVFLCALLYGGKYAKIAMTSEEQNKL